MCLQYALLPLNVNRDEPECTRVSHQKPDPKIKLTLLFTFLPSNSHACMTTLSHPSTDATLFLIPRPCRQRTALLPFLSLSPHNLLLMDLRGP
jgi:hypothetical protein